MKHWHIALVGGLALFLAAGVIIAFTVQEGRDDSAASDDTAVYSEEEKLGILNRVEASREEPVPSEEEKLEILKKLEGQPAE